ncbi:hypothetical protein ACIQUY_04765 [Streptomyces sp. NPDC090231]|uniref:hypothetical protein n=1 Tax=unclassified Streptomyces TaxID=2593676 RepID=UPI003807F691
MSPEILVAAIAAVAVVVAAVVAALPPLLQASRRTRGTVEAQGAETRAATLDALNAVGSRLEARFNARIDDVRDDIDNVREGVARVREWQAGHDAEHLTIGRPRNGGGST